MDGWDFGILWQGGQAILSGQDPYSVPFFLYPLPVAYFMAVLALLPQSVAFGAWLALNLGLLIYFFRKRFWQWLLFTPVLHTFSSGQVELVLWSMAQGLGRHWRGAGLAALITLKPQTAIVLLPWFLWDWLRYDRRTFVTWIGFTGLLWGFPLLWRPNWISDWMQAVPAYDVYESGSNAPGVFSLLRVVPDVLPLIVVIAVVVFIWGQWQSREIARATAQLGSPVGLFYSTLQMLDSAPAWLLVPLSWLAVVLMLLTRTTIPFTLLPLAVIVWQVRQKRNHD